MKSFFLDIEEALANGPCYPAVELEEDLELEEKAFEPKDISRKSSLTVEELEASAEQEAAELEERQRAVEAGELEPEESRRLISNEAETGPGTGLGGGGGLRDGQQRPVLTQSILGFTADMIPPEEAIDDRPEAPETE